MTAIVVTGVGLITPLGEEPAAVLDALDRGERAVRIVDDLAGEAVPPVPLAPVPDFDPTTKLGRSRSLKYMSRASAFAVFAARRALADADLDPRAIDGGDAVGIFAGHGMTSSEVTDLEAIVGRSMDEHGALSMPKLGRDGLRAANPLLSFRILSNMPLCHVAMDRGVRGPNAALHSLGGETVAALADAVDALRDGRARVALWGGVDGQLDRAGVLQLIRQGQLPSGAELTDVTSAQPFDGDSAGRALAEGAAFLVLERAEDAAARGARPRATIDGIGLAPARTTRLRSAKPEPIRLAIARALGQPDQPPSRSERDLAGVFSSACGDGADRFEERALADSVDAAVPITTTRGGLGDALAAGPAIDAALAVAAIERDPTAGRRLIVSAGASATVGAALLAPPTPGGGR